MKLFTITLKGGSSVRATATCPRGIDNDEKPLYEIEKTAFLITWNISNHW